MNWGVWKPINPPTNQSIKTKQKNTCPGLVTSSGRTEYAGSWTVHSYIAKERKVCLVREFGLARRCWTLLRIPNLPTATFSRGKLKTECVRRRTLGCWRWRQKLPRTSNSPRKPVLEPCLREAAWSCPFALAFVGTSVLACPTRFRR